MRIKAKPIHAEEYLSWFGAEPVQRQTVGTSVISTAATSTTPFGFATSTQADDLSNTVRLIRTALINYGLII